LALQHGLSGQVVAKAEPKKAGEVEKARVSRYSEHASGREGGR